MSDPITSAEIHAAELAALRDEVDQQRTRAEAAEAEAFAEILARKAAEAELREAKKAIEEFIADRIDYPAIRIREYFGHKALWCRIGGVSFPRNDTVRLHLHARDCTDMGGAIAYAKKVCSGLVDFRLRVVHTIAADGKETYYIKLVSGEWDARVTGDLR